MPPERPHIRPDTRITALRRCFAVNLSNWLSARNHRAPNRGAEAQNACVVSCGEGKVDSFVIRQPFEWAWENEVSDQPLRHGHVAEDYGDDPAVQEETRRIFERTDVFGLTFSLSEMWHDAPTGNVVRRSVPRDRYEPERHRVRASTVAENVDNPHAIHRPIRTHRPEDRIVFTLSPVPLVATSRDHSGLTSNSVSMAVLRAARAPGITGPPAN